MRLFLAVLAAVAIAACTFGVGDYEAGTMSAAPGLEEGGGGVTPDPALPVGLDATPSSDAQIGDSGLCANGTSTTCSKPDALDGAICAGMRTCIAGKWGPCEVEPRCPSTWQQSTTTSCSNVDAVGASSLPRWTSNPAQGAPVTLWTVARATSFDTYGRNDKFCFVPKHMGSCNASSQVALEVVCTGGQKKITNNDFESGTIHRAEYCVDFSGPSCSVIDKHASSWTSGAATCERWFELVNFRVDAAPQCAPW